MDKTVIWDRTPPAIHQLQCICVGEGSRVPNLQTEFNYLDSFKSYGILVILLSPWSPHGPSRPCVIPVIPMLSPHHPHIIPIAPRRSPCGPRHPCCPHPCCPCQACCPHVIPIIRTLLLSASRHLEGPQIISNPQIATLGVGGSESLKMQ